MALASRASHASRGQILRIVIGQCVAKSWGRTIVKCIFSRIRQDFMAASEVTHWYRQLTFLFLSPPSSKCLHRLMGSCLRNLHSVHSILKTIFFVVLA